MTVSVLAAVAGGCGGPSPVSENAAGAGSLPDVENRSPDPMSGAGDAGPSTAAAPGAADRAVAEIPTVLQGRWALNPDDCDSTTPSPSVLVVTSDALRFYESVARPVGNIGRSADSIGGDFAFEGEGQTWKRSQTLQLQEGQLVRTESNPAASYTYVRCT